MAMARATNVDHSDDTRDLPVGVGVSAHLSESQGEVSCSLQTTECATVKAEINFQACEIETLSIGKKRKTRIKYRIPFLPEQYVHRSSHEEIITQWLENAHAPALLRLCGLGSAGKSCLGIWAAHTATTVGFSKVLWWKAELCQLEDEALDNECQDMLDLHPDLTAEGGRVLLILDNVMNNRILSRLRKVNFLLITTRKQTIGDFSETFSDTLQQVSVGGLSVDECDRLVLAIVRKEVFEMLKTEERLMKVREICRLFDNFPLSVQLISVRLYKDYEIWRTQTSDDYIDQLMEELKTTRQRLREKASKMGIAADTGYKFGNSHAAIFWSIERLPDDEKEKYRLLSIFRRSETIRSVTVLTMWMTTEYATFKCLQSFCGVHLLTPIDDDAEEYTLHDLVFEVLQVWTQEERKELATQVVRRYKTKAVVNEQTITFECIADEDDWFYRRIVGLCIETEQLDNAVEIFCSFCFLSSRIGLGYINGIFQDMKALLSERQLEVDKWEDIILKCLSRNVKSKEEALDHILRLSLMWPHGLAEYIDIYQKAIRAVKTGVLPDRPFLRIGSAYILKSTLSATPYRSLDGLPHQSDHSKDIPCVAVNQENKAVVAGSRKSLFFFNDVDNRVKREFDCKGRVVLVKWIDGTSCLFVTEENVHGGLVQLYRGGIVRRQASGEVTSIFDTKLVNTCLDCVLFEYSGGFLWSLKVEDQTMRCFRITPTLICLTRKTQLRYRGRCYPCLFVSPCGRICVVNEMGPPSTLHVMDLSVKESRPVSWGKKVSLVAFLSEKKMLLLFSSDENKYTFVIHDLQLGATIELTHIPRTFYFNDGQFLFGDTLFFGCNGGALMYFCLQSQMCDKVKILHHGNIFWDICDHVIFAWSDHGILTLYDLREVKSWKRIIIDCTSKHGVEVSKPLFIEWNDGVEDFVAVCLEKEAGKWFYRVWLLRKREVPLSISWRNTKFSQFSNTSGSICHQPSPPGLSVVGCRIAIIIESSVEEFDWRVGQKLWSLSLPGVTAVAHTSDGGGVWATARGRLLLIVDGHRRRCVVTDCTVVSRLVVVGDVCVCEEDQFQRFHGILSAWRGAELVLPRRECRMYSVSRRGRRCVLFTTQGELFVWRLDTGTETLLSDRHEINSELFLSRDGLKCSLNARYMTFKFKQRTFEYSEVGKVIVFNTDTGERLSVLKLDPGIQKIVALSSSNPTFLLTSHQNVHIYDYQHRQSVLLISAMKGDRICVSSKSDVVCFWSYLDGSVLFEIVQRGRSPLTLDDL